MAQQFLSQAPSVATNRDLTECVRAVQGQGQMEGVDAVFCSCTAWRSMEAVAVSFNLTFI